MLTIHIFKWIVYSIVAIRDICYNCKALSKAKWKELSQIFVIKDNFLLNCKLHVKYWWY